MTNPYLQAAQEITGQDLTNAFQKSLAPTAAAPHRTLKQQAKKVYIPKPSKLPQHATFAPKSQFGSLGALSGFSKISKMVFLAAIGAGFAASKLFINKYEVLLLAEHPEYTDLRRMLPKVDKVLLPATALFAFPTALALFTDNEWPMLGWLSWLAAIAYTLKETGPEVYSIIKETKNAAEDYKEKKLVAAKRRARK